MNCACPHCGNPVVVALAAPPRPEPVVEPDRWLEPCLIADRLGIGEAYVRRLINRGMAAGIVGCEKRGGRLFATVEAVRELRG